MASTPAFGNGLATKFVKQGHRLDATGDHEKALKVYVEALKLEPSNLSIQDALFESAKEAVDKSPKTASSYITLGDAYAYRGDYNLARNTFRMAVQLASNRKENAVAATALGKILKLQPLGRNSHSASAWIKANDLATPSRDESIAFYRNLEKSIKRAWHPPKGNESKRVIVHFKVHKGGDISNLRTQRSCGVALADEAALKAVTDAAPFGPLPPRANDPMDVQFTFDYDAFNRDGGGNTHVGFAK